MTHYHNERPALFRYQQSFSFKESTLEFYLEVDKNEVVKGLYYTWQGKPYLLDELSSYALVVEGSKLHETPAPNTDQWSHPYFFYRKMISNITQAEVPMNIQKGKDPYELICRCSAVYESDIRDLIQRKLSEEVYEFDSVFKSIGSELMATIGCGSCKIDVDNILAEYIKGDRNSAPVEEAPVREELPRWQSLDSQNLARESFTLLKAISEQIKVDLKLLGTRPGSILIKAAVLLTEEQTSSVENSFRDAFGAGLEIQLK